MNEVITVTCSIVDARNYVRNKDPNLENLDRETSANRSGVNFFVEKCFSDAAMNVENPIFLTESPIPPQLGDMLTHSGFGSAVCSPSMKRKSFIKDEKLEDTSDEMRKKSPMSNPMTDMKNEFFNTHYV